MWSARAHEVEKMCLNVEHTFSQMGESARDGAQSPPKAFPFWELHLCEGLKCSKLWLER
jgi:hypothetical protein